MILETCSRTFLLYVIVDYQFHSRVSNRDGTFEISARVKKSSWDTWDSLLLWTITPLGDSSPVVVETGL